MKHQLKDGQPVRIKRRHDQARTPFDRLCDTKMILPEHREQLKPCTTGPIRVSCDNRSTMLLIISSLYLVLFLKSKRLSI
jgi:hypothetical protein